MGKKCYNVTKFQIIRFSLLFSVFCVHFRLAMFRFFCNIFCNTPACSVTLLQTPCNIIFDVT